MKKKDSLFGHICTLVYLDHSKEIQHRLRSIITLMHKSRKGMLHSKAYELETAILRTNNNRSRGEWWKHVQASCLSDSFRYATLDWYEEGHAKELLNKLPACYQSVFPEPAKLLGQATYHEEQRSKIMSLLSFAAAMAVVEEWRASTQTLQNAAHIIIQTGNASSIQIKNYKYHSNEYSTDMKIINNGFI